MSMATSDDFVARLARVKANAGRSIIMVGADDSFVHERKARQVVSRRREVGETLVAPAGLAMALLLGMVAVLLGQVLRFHLTAGGDELRSPGTELVLLVGVGLAGSFVLAQVFRLTSKGQRALQGLGVLVMACSSHTLSHWMPGPMSLAFSQQWVAQIQNSAPPNTLLLGETYLAWGQAPLAAGLSEVQTVAGICATGGARVQLIVLDSAKDPSVAKAGTEPQDCVEG